MTSSAAPSPKIFEHEYFFLSAYSFLFFSFHKLQMHTASLRHKCFVRAYRRIHQAEEEERRDSAQSTQQLRIFYCSLCDYGARTRDGILSKWNLLDFFSSVLRGTEGIRYRGSTV